MSSQTRMFNTVSQIDNSKETWRMKVRVVRYIPYPVWNRPNEVRMIDMVLSDEKNDRIQASCRGELARRLLRGVHEGHAYVFSMFHVAENFDKLKTCDNKYKINLHKQTYIKNLDDAEIPQYKLKFTSFSDIIHQIPDPEIFIDVIGLLKSKGPVETVESKGETKNKMLIELSDGRNQTIEVYLWGDFVNQLNNYINDVNNMHHGVVVVMLEFAKLNYFNGKTSVSNSFYASRLSCNRTCSDVTEFLHSLGQVDRFVDRRLEDIEDVRSVSVVDDFARIPHRVYINQLQNIEQIGVCAVAAKIVRIETQHGWFYLACRVCSSKVKVEDNGTYYCVKCKNAVNYVNTRFRVVFRVTDTTGDTSFTLFCREMVQLLGRTAADLREALIQDGDDDLFPIELDGLVQKTYLFKISVTQYNLSDAVRSRNWTVTRVTQVPSILAGHYAHLNPDEVGDDASENAGTISIPFSMTSENDLRGFSDVNSKQTSPESFKTSPGKRTFFQIDDDIAIGTETGQGSAVGKKVVIKIEKVDVNQPDIE